MNTKSFTLIEILVALVILGILSTFIIISLNNVVDSANDAKRKKDLDSIAKGLMVYRNLSGTYPTGSDCDIGDGTCLDELVEAGYATTFPIDPSGSRYKYTSDGTTYTIKAILSDNQTLSYSPDTGYSQYAGLAGWSKRKSITVSNSGSSLTNYQMKFTVYRSTGTDSGFNVYVGTNCQSDYRDIRFTNSSNSVLDYWIESSSAATATIWVEVDTITGSGDTTIYLYYGNGVAESESSGTNTFDFFDDFPGSSVDTGKWDVVAGSPSVSGGSITLEDGGQETITTKSGYATNYAIRTRLAAPVNKFSMWGFYQASLDTHRAWFYPNINSDNQYAVQTQAGGSAQGASIGSTYTGTRTWDVIRNGSSSVIFRVDDSTVATHTSYVSTQTIKGTLFTHDVGGNPDIVADWFLVRKYTSTEPTISLWGEEETI